MTFFDFLFQIIAGVILWNWLWKSVYRVESNEDETHWIKTSDGWRIALHHYQPRAKQHSVPVILCHGMGANRLTFDMNAKQSLAVYLRDQGFDVWSLELRGHGLSDRPGFMRHQQFGWGVDDYLEKDMPAAITAVCEKTHSTQVHWVGHSMGAILGWSRLALNSTPDLLNPNIKSAVLIAGAIDYSETSSDYHFLKRARPISQFLPALPVSWLTCLISPFAGRLENRIEAFKYELSNLDGLLARKLQALGFHPISMPVMNQLATAMESGGLLIQKGSFKVKEHLGQITTPVLAIAADRDRQCAPYAIESSLKLLSGTENEFRCFGTGSGQETHYGHFDVLFGKRVESEVFPVIANWLKQKS